MGKEKKTETQTAARGISEKKKRFVGFYLFLIFSETGKNNKFIWFFRPRAPVPEKIKTEGIDY